ncbi:MAG: MFS transporter [Dehalococcoidia bacterium]
MNRPTDETAPGEARLRERPARFHAFASLQHRDFFLLWVGTLFASGGVWIQQTTVGWLVWELSGSPLLVGTVTGIRALPLLILGPWGGVAADRLDRRHLLIGTHVVLTVAAFLFALVIATGQVQVWHAFVFVLVAGSAWSFNQPVRQALVANTVPSRDLMNAVALNAMAFQLSRVIGPAAGGVLILVGMRESFLLQGLLYLGVALAALPMRVRFEHRPLVQASVFSNLIEGMRFVWRDRILLGLIAMAFATVIFTMPAIHLMPVFAAEILHAGPEVLGLLLSAIGVGALVASLAVASIREIPRKGTILFVTAALAAVCLTLFAFSTWLVLSVIILALMGFFQLFFRMVNMTLVQVLSPDALRGRVMSIYMWDQGLLPLGSLIMGTLAQVWSAPTAVVSFGLASLVLLLFLALRFRALRQL